MKWFLMKMYSGTNTDVLVCFWSRYFVGDIIISQLIEFKQLKNVEQAHSWSDILFSKPYHSCLTLFSENQRAFPMLKLIFVDFL